MTVQEKLKAHIIERVNANDWKGAMNLLDAIILVGDAPTISQTPPIVEQVPDNERPQATDFDAERTQKLG